jgi:predicted Zn-dependent peptidase
LTEDIFFNHTFDEDTLPKKKVATKEDYDMMYHIFINCKLTATEAADYRYKCSRNDIEYNMNFINQWYNESLQALERHKKIKRQSKRDKCNNHF